ncbi:uncharacterized protein LOC143895447 isoform X2 [Temnothorax americanus]|uniref:uncharacterized protein LOC143895447 isoform X2 n=1 Tax=Temnothorax americanus TaxID=1964332 RepID=UPI00406885AE
MIILSYKYSIVILREFNSLFEYYIKVTNYKLQSNIPNVRDNSWKKIRHKRVMTLALKWQDCPVNAYYKNNRILLLCVGLWPYQKSISRYIAITLTTIIHVSSVIFQMQALMEQILCDWNELNDDAQEIEIIKEYADIGRFITLITILFIYVSIFFCILTQFLSNFLPDITSSRNESRPRQLPILVECFIDQQKYFFPILLLVCLVVLCGLTTVAATETLNMSYTHHACGLFEIASCRIEQALLKNTVEGIASSTERNSMICQGIINGFNMYKKAIEFIEILKRSYTWAYSVLLPLGVLSLSINLYRFSRLIISKEYYEIIVSFLFIVGHFWYMFFCNYLGQKVIDHSSDVFHRIYNAQWYLAPLRAQKLLMLMMQRSMRHCTLVIDGLFIPSFEGFATLASTSISYFTVIFSLF